MTAPKDLAAWLRSPQCGLQGDERVQEAAALLERLAASETREPDPSQTIPDGMWFFTFFCEDYDAVQRVRVNADAPRHLTCGVTGIAMQGSPRKRCARCPYPKGCMVEDCND